MRAPEAGFLEPLMGLGDQGVSGNRVAFQRHSCGEVVREYATPVAGGIATLQGNGVVEPGMRIGKMRLNGPDPARHGRGRNDEDGEPIE